MAVEGPGDLRPPGAPRAKMFAIGSPSASHLTFTFKTSRWGYAILIQQPGFRTAFQDGSSLAKVYLRHLVEQMSMSIANSKAMSAVRGSRHNI